MSNPELIHQLKQAATSMLTDEEICVALNITADQLAENYAVVEQARVVLKQQLNAKRIKEASGKNDQATALVETIPRSKISSRGGARQGAGRKAGTTNKISAQSLLASRESHTGEPLEDLLAQGYYESIVNRDKQTRLQYEKMFLSKVVADRVNMEITENSDLIEAKKQAFDEAIAKLTGSNEETK
jgi:hypothetical protein